MSRAVRVVDVRRELPDQTDLTEVAWHVRDGGVLAYPTETVYGFGGVCTPEAVARVSALKRRAEDKPLLVLVESADAVADLEWSVEARELAGIFWPGALTLVLRDPRCLFPPGIRSEAGAVAVRVSPHPWVQALLRAVGEPITSTSANPPGSRPARSGSEAARAAELLGAGSEVLVLDAGELEVSDPSTIIDCTSSRSVVVREGSVPVGRLRCVLPEIQESLRVPEAEGKEDARHREPFRLLFVCTGNTCRSPMAEALARRELEALGGGHAEVRSAGTGAAEGVPASEGARRAAARNGLDLSLHRSTPVTPELLEWADLVLAMSTGHLLQVVALGYGDKASLLTSFAAGEGADGVADSVQDPFGGSDAEYEQTFHLLDRLVQQALRRLEPVLAP